MAAWHPEARVRRGDARRFTYQWSAWNEFGWEFDADWEDAASVSERELDVA